jgi:hypothetical protein
MYNTKFNSLAEAMKLNNMTEASLVAHMQRYFDNQNYRSNYNARKNELSKLLANDPVVKQRVAELKKKAK